MENYPALRYLIDNPERLYPEERLELISLLGHTVRLEKVLTDADALVQATKNLDKGALLRALRP